MAPAVACHGGHLYWGRSPSPAPADEPPHCGRPVTAGRAPNLPSTPGHTRCVVVTRGSKPTRSALWPRGNRCDRVSEARGPRRTRPARPPRSRIRRPGRPATTSTLSRACSTPPCERKHPRKTTLVISAGVPKASATTRRSSLQWAHFGAAAAGWVSGLVGRSGRWWHGPAGWLTSCLAVAASLPPGRMASTRRSRVRSRTGHRTSWILGEATLADPPNLYGQRIPDVERR